MSQNSPQTSDDTPTPKPRRMSQAERTELSDQLMLDAAMALILEDGTQRTTLKDVGERAGYSRGLANARFGSRDELFLRLLERSRLTWTSIILDLAKGKSGVDELVSRLDAICVFAEKHPNEARTMYILWFEAIGSHTKASEDLTNFHKLARADIRDLALKAGLFKETEREAAERYAIQFCGTLFGLCYQWIVNEKVVDIRANVEDLKTRLLKL